MKSSQFRIVFNLIMATLVLTTGWGLSDVPEQPAVQQTFPPTPEEPAVGTTTRVSVASDGTEGNCTSSEQSISADGRYVAFASCANNLVSGEINSAKDIYLHDRQTGSTELVSVASDGNHGQGNSYDPSISADGRYVTFFSDSNNLVSGDTNGTWDVFVHDRQTGVTERVSVSSDGSQGNASSFSTPASISADGRYVAFGSASDNLVSGDTNQTLDIFVYDRQTRITELISLASDGSWGNSESQLHAISADGRHVAFASSSSNLVNGDTNGVMDVFVHDQQTGTTERVSVASDGSQGNDQSSDWIHLSISADGRFVVFASDASNLVEGDINGKTDIFVRDRLTGITEHISVSSDGNQGNGDSVAPSISANGRYVAFISKASNLVSGDTNNYCGDNKDENCSDVFVHDRQTGVTERVSVANDMSQGDSGSYSYNTSITPDGRYVAFSSYASNLVVGDTNGFMDVFVRDRGEVAFVFYLPVTLNQP
jgi:Tol biopolymer transport system component